MNEVTWVLEPDIFPHSHEPVRAAIRARGHHLVDWSDEWWSGGVPARVPRSRVLFHGSLGNAARIAEELCWSPGSFCHTRPFHCSSWYESARKWLVHTDWVICAANELVARAPSIARQLGSAGALFVRPDSPLKPFSGRVVEVATLTLAKLDHGFYYEDDTIPVVAAPIQAIGKEWRFVVVNRAVVAGSAYDPQTRKAVRAPLDSTAAEFASTVAADISAPERVFVLDVCECNGRLRLLELNPFGGADLYACDATAVVDKVSAIAAAHEC